MPETEQGNLFGEMRGMREELRKVLQELGSLTAEVRHLAHSQEQTLGFGERIRSLETDVSNVKQSIKDEQNARESSERSAATERRWVVTILVTVVLGLIGVIGSILQKGHP